MRSLRGFMRRKVAGHLCAVLKGILFIGFSIQAVMGLVWMCLNFTAVQEFAPEKSAAYDALCLLTGDCAPLMYLLQLSAAAFADWRILGAIRREGVKWRVWGTVVLLTFPMAMQCHLALLPWSFAGSLLLLEWSFVIELLQKRERSGRNFALAGLSGCWPLLAVFLPEYRLLGGIPAVLAVLLHMGQQLWRKPSRGENPGEEEAFGKGVREKKRLWQELLLTLAAAGLAIGAGTAARAASGIEERSVSFALACRTVWYSIRADHYGWPDELQQVMEEEDHVYEISLAPDNMDRIMKPLMEERFGEEQAKAYYRYMAKNSWEHRKTAILSQMRWDMAGYAATPLILQRQLEGAGYDSYSGRNYEIMRNHAPVWTGLYVAYSCRWFGCFSVTALLLSLTLIIGRQTFCGAGGFPWKNSLKGIFVCGLSAGAVVLWYTLQGSGIMDYRKSFAVSSIWLIWALTAMREEETHERGRSVAEKAK